MIPDSVRKYVYYEEPGIVLLHGDCLEILPHFEPKSIDLVLTDPPYGIDTWNNRGATHSKLQDCDNYKWDYKPIKEIKEMLKFDKCFIWGYNYFSDILPSTKKALIWDKCFRGMHFNDCELCWTKGVGEASRIFTLSRNKEGKKYHPTEKPLSLIKWCLDMVDDAQLILDPFLGSGTTAVACKQLGRKCIGIEIDAKYLDIAIERLRQEVLF